MKINLVTNILKANEVLARENREIFHQYGVLVINLMSSPGSGKTTILERTIDCLHDQIAIGVIEGDLYTARDAERIEKRGIPVVQINTTGGCHLDARMIAGALEKLPLKDLDLLIIENVGNLVCPAEYDLGEAMKVTVLSVTEGNDKPEKYPSMFRKSRAVIANKTDLLPYTDFDLPAFTRDVRAINPEATIFSMSAREGEGIKEWCDWLKQLAAEKS
ncbi:MAG: hydrogenase nickel incorporation protein HypB [Firmicutes bacterium]|nr:hydrogenase nickel incorporation protein HypB [Bacillota bacterium]